MTATPKTKDSLMAAAQMAGVIASAWFFWFHAALPRLGRESLAGLIGEALFLVTIAWICGALVTYCVYIVVSLADTPDVMRFSWRSAAPAMWFAPALLLLSAPTPAAFPVSMVLIINATRLLVSQWVTIESPVTETEPARAGGRLLFGDAAEQATFFPRSWVSVLIGSFAAQAGLVAMLWHNPLLAAVCLGASVAILTSLAIVSGAYRPEGSPALPFSWLSIAITFLLAVALSFGGMAVGRSSGAGSEAATPHVTKIVPPADEGTEIGGGFPGVILRPEVKPQTTLLAPAPGPPRMTSAALSHPVGIPFSGEYWMFKPPRTRPPQRSIIRRGRPSEPFFRTMDGAPMEMEAHQRLAAPIDIRCCSGIQLDVINTDRHPGTVSLELILIDSEGQGSRSESLGIVLVGSSSSLIRTLSFAIPRVAALRRFDELKIVFHCDDERSDKSARIAIDRIVLAP